MFDESSVYHKITLSFPKILTFKYTLKILFLCFFFNKKIEVKLNPTMFR